MKIIAKIIFGTAVVMSTGAVFANTPSNQAVVATATVKTVQQALNAKEDSKVELRGHVVKSLGNEKYEFRDSTGVITVDIDDDVLNGRPISANMIVTLMGKVDIDHRPKKRVEIEVKSIRF